ncbi:hypothetical protein NDU88_009415 [Pleurodeles waltl]|uniref:Uncharacterized protein n=1 Tax=Pleurodeles waltl TaxID=8319 RepID=A0AAV7QVQ9_PLEWA|nr:hypothetical protein NDU88_009415 [Pleurodeles waltl]
MRMAEGRSTVVIRGVRAPDRGSPVCQRRASRSEARQLISAQESPKIRGPTGSRAGEEERRFPLSRSIEADRPGCGGSLVRPSARLRLSGAVTARLASRGAPQTKLAPRAPNLQPHRFLPPGREEKKLLLTEALERAKQQFGDAEARDPGHE